jgi:hypothetical protein
VVPLKGPFGTDRQICAVGVAREEIEKATKEQRGLRTSRQGQKYIVRQTPNARLILVVAESGNPMPLLS